MKRFISLFAVIATFAAMPACAQFKFGIKAGMNASDMKLNLENITHRSGKGWFVGPMVKFTAPTGLLKLGADGAVLYDERQSKAEMEGIEETIKQKSILVPINVRLNFDILSLLGVYASTGPQFGFNVGDKGFDIGNLKNSFQLKKSQFSWNVGVGVTAFKHLEVGATYCFALGSTGELKDMTGSEITSPKQKSWTVSAAYFF